MKVRRPTHATLVAYLALFVALGGTAIAARDYLGAKELKTPVVRERVRTVPADSPQTFWSVVARCHSKEKFVSGGGGWTFGADALPARSVMTRAQVTTRRRNGPAVGYEVGGFNPPGAANELVAQAVCLPR